ncbi:MAG: hypothetical protein IT356_10925 [Gemmatimonadaceae bacterium]|nr:hypothetical protein [Gemmatimonadaceae bacterium]
MWATRLSLAAAILLGGFVVGCGERAQRGGGAGADGREAIRVPAEARDAVLLEMRTMLGSLHDLLTASVPGDAVAMQAAAKRSGLGAAADTALEHLLPEKFLQLGVATHQQFDDLAAALGAGLPRDSVVVRLSRITGNCVACHAAYRLEAR